MTISVEKDRNIVPMKYFEFPDGHSVNKSAYKYSAHRLIFKRIFFEMPKSSKKEYTTFTSLNFHFILLNMFRIQYEIFNVLKCYTNTYREQVVFFTEIINEIFPFYYD